MLIQLDKYIYTMKMWKHVTNHFSDYQDIKQGINLIDDADLKICWGALSELTGKRAVMETGFFWDASHIDTVGLYQYSSLNTPTAIKAIAEYDAKVSAKELVGRMKGRSKYPQGQDPEWKIADVSDAEIVLACQEPHDRSIRSVTSPENYYKFIEDACKFYGDSLFIKLHPWNSGESGERIRQIAKNYNVRAAKVNHRVLENCKFCLVFNSTFAVDCFVRDVPVAHYAPGYFYQLPAVEYTEFTFPTDIKTDLQFAQKTCDFLIWNYCFDHSMSVDKWIEIFEIFAKSNKMFPLPERLSYATNKL